ncbi:glypican-5b [Acipenser oxyrinchus oxyrinchus]|uniref:Glypican-5b n=1 Tax=Acipenser oxyrinchus oxyrinchus TaxID=40147 RepID=A0AAD8G5I2_ACIOX|nr:glypican-5b [Acipenser oxyrinchus oxyrinchus]
MSQGMFPRVSPLVVPLLLLLSAGELCLGSPSCQEVRTAFQLRQIGPLKWVPDVPGTDEELQVCQHRGPTCCTRKMEESYQVAVRRETLQTIQSYSFELKFLLVGHATSFQDAFQSLLHFAQNHTSSLFESAYRALAHEAIAPVKELFTDLSLYILGSDDTVEGAVQRFYDNLFPLVYNRLVNPGIGTMRQEYAECLRMTRQDVNPFGSHPKSLVQELSRLFKAGRTLSKALNMGVEVINATEHTPFTRECGRALVRMHYCSHCQGLTLIKPCVGYCLNVMRGCLPGLAELDQPWWDYISNLEELTNAMAGAHDLELALLGIRNQVNDAILYTQLNGPRLTATVDKVCGQPAERVVHPSPETIPPPRSTPAPKPPIEAQLGRLSKKRSSLPLKSSKNDKPRSLKKISRDFVSYMQRYKTFYSALAELLCEGELVRDSSTCWSGEDVVESYTNRVVGNGLQAQKLNPEVKVRGLDPVLTQVKERLQRFNQEMLGKVGGHSDRMGTWEPGSGDASGDCDDEDGCQGSGEGDLKEDNIIAKTADRWKNELFTKDPPRGKERGFDTTQQTTTTSRPLFILKGGSRMLRPSLLLLLLLLLPLS